MNDQEQIDYNQPVAYDANGRPLYAHPPASAAPVTPPPITVDSPVSTPTEPEVKHPASAHGDASTRYIASKKKYPHLNLSNNEYVINEVGRHPIGLFPIVGAVGLVDIAGFCFLLLYPAMERAAVAGTVPAFSTIILPIAMVIILATLIAYAAAVIYFANRFYLTNESVIEELQQGLFARKERTVSLGNIEEVTFTQSNIFQTMFDYGTVRMAIEGDHNAYKFLFVSKPKKQVDLLVNTIEECKRHGGGHH